MNLLQQEQAVSRELRKELREMKAALDACQGALAHTRGDSPLLTYMTTADGPTRDAAFLHTYAERVRNGTAVTWEIPNTVAATIDGIANRLDESGARLRRAEALPHYSSDDMTIRHRQVVLVDDLRAALTGASTEGP